MKIILFSHDSGGNGGASKSFITVLECLIKQRYDLLIIMPEKGELCEKLDALNIDYKVIYYPWWFKTRKHRTTHLLSKLKVWLKPISFFTYTLHRYLKAFFQLKKVIKTFNPDMIYTNTLSHPLGLISALAFNIKHVWHVREFVEEDHFARFVFGFTFSRYFINLSHINIYISNALADKYQYKSNQGYKIIPNAVYKKTELKSMEALIKRPSLKISKEISLLSVGRISEGKRHDVAISVLPILRAKQINATLKILGHGNTSALKSQARKINIENSVKFIGYTSNVRDYYLKADFLIVASEMEAFGRVVIEAMACGAIVIGRKSGGIPDIIEHGVNGFLFEKETEIPDIIENVVNSMETDQINNIRLNAFKDCLEKYTIEQLENSIVTTLRKIATNE